MTTDIIIPPEALKAGHEAFVFAMLHVAAPDPMEAAIRAAIKAWPGWHIHEWQRPWVKNMNGADIILPLPQEPSND